MSNPIVTENQNTGSTSWQVTKGASTQIQAYANLTSVAAGSSINFYVSTQVAGTSYTISIYRTGWYGGAGGCLKHTSPTQTGVAQGYWDASNTTLVNCPTAIIDNATHLLETGWATSYAWSVPSNACTGVYLAQFTDANGYQSYCSFVVLGNMPAEYCYVMAISTEAAYNDWGGYSLYTNPGVGVKVSFNRPCANSFGAQALFRYELAGIKWFERQGYNITYLTSIDLHSNPAQLLNCWAYLSPGHDEYWSKEMRDGVEKAIASGVGAAFLGGNAVYWQCRFENDHAGNPNRTVTCYKVIVTSSTVNTLSNDPYFGVDNTRVTTQWQYPPVQRPELSMIGIMYTSYVASFGSNVGWTVDASANSSFLNGTGLVPGQTYGYDLVGNEFDKVQYGGPSNLQIIGTSPITDINSGANISNTTVYTAPSGALVFASGSIAWTWALDTYRYQVQLGGTPAEIPGMQILLSNVMSALINGRTSPTVRYSAFLAHR